MYSSHRRHSLSFILEIQEPWRDVRVANIRRVRSNPSAVTRDNENLPFMGSEGF